MIIMMMMMIEVHFYNNLLLLCIYLCRGGYGDTPSKLLAAVAGAMMLTVGIPSCRGG